MESGISGDLASVLDGDKIAESQNSERLREFYKQLLQTDAQIRRLKEAITNTYQNDKSFTDRFKRSLRNRLKLYKTTKNNNNKNINSDWSNNNINNIKGDKIKRANNDNVNSIMVKKEKIMVQYEPYKGKNFNTHEMPTYGNQFHESFYKMQQNIQDMMEQQQQHGITTKSYFTTIKNTETTIKEKGNIGRKLKDAKNDFIITDYKTFEGNKEKATFDNVMNIVNNLDYDMKNLLTTNVYDGVSNITFIIPEFKATNIRRLMPGQRNLLQVDEEKNEINYEELKDIVSDQEDYEDINKRMERIKRDTKQELNDLKNFNWNGPMPLQSEELINAMIKQAAIQNLNIQIPINTKDNKIEKDAEENDISDTEYIEDYVDSKYNKMVKMAQAYSDYGVVYGKSDSSKSNNLDDKFKVKEQEELKLKLPFEKQNLVNRFFRKLDKGFMNDGLKIEFKPGNVPTDHIHHHDKGIEKHIKILNNPLENTNTFKYSDDYDKASSFINFDSTTDRVISQKPDTSHFKIKSGSRSLMSVDFDATLEKGENISRSTSRSILGHILFVICNWFNDVGDWLGKKFGDFINIFYRRNRVESNVTRINDHTLKDMNTPYRSYTPDNINRKTRVLMSTEDNSNLKENIAIRSNITNVGEKIKLTDLEDTVPVALVVANDIENASKGISTKNSDTNKVIVKRSPEKVFWNDLYDNDEYGIKIDYLDGARNKHSAKKNVVQKSKDWVKNKVKKIKDKFRKKKKEKKLDKTTMTTTTMKTTTTKTRITKKRPVRQSDENENNDIKKTFEKLTANMKRICQKAARDIEKTRHVGVREENKEDKAATSLMQHLVRLMADLVDIQVQQKTCAKLPSDLRDFLEWLTVPADNKMEVNNLEMNPGLFDHVTNEDGGRYGKSTDSTLDLPTYNEDTHQDDRTECLGIIKSVQDLIQRYEEMTDEDKSKMTGVKEYLDNQLEFLNTKLGVINDYTPYKSYDKRQTSRNRRYVWNNKNHRDDKNKFVKTFGKKHTKSTLHTYDGITMTKIKKKNDNKNINNGRVILEQG